MNAVVARLTRRSLLGGRRLLVMAGLPIVLIGLACLVRGLVGVDDDIAVAVTIVFGLGTLTPLLGLIAGTGSIGPEIGDGSIIYILSKPLARGTIIRSKLFVASCVAAAFSAVPIYVAGVIVTGDAGGLAIAAAAGAVAASIAYCALFLLLAVVTRNAVVIGLLYALVWESLIGQLVAGAQELSIQQWSLSITAKVLGEDSSFDPDAAVGFSTGVVLLVIVVTLATWLATRSLRKLRLSNEE